MNSEILLFTTIIELIVIVFLDLIIFKQYSMIRDASEKIADFKYKAQFWEDDSTYWRHSCDYWRDEYIKKLRNLSEKSKSPIIKTSKSKGGSTK